MKDWLLACWNAIAGRSPRWSPPPEGQMVARRLDRMRDELEVLREIVDLIERENAEDRRRRTG
jgi:hypothetical protein